MTAFAPLTTPDCEPFYGPDGAWVECPDCGGEGGEPARYPYGPTTCDRCEGRGEFLVKPAEMTPEQRLEWEREAAATARVLAERRKR